ncbi:MAG: helix-turn-helix domain-containing protein [Leptospirales bacterium]
MLNGSDINKLLTNGEAAEYLGMSPDTLPRWRWAGIGPAYLKVGRSIKYRRADLEAFLNESRVNPRNGAA